ncbi:hypothetical protein CVS40_12809 [Lucilia cuprina]|nr:hypothetical protein CVS40_12809 [Lucilia cuprina]
MAPIKILFLYIACLILLVVPANAKKKFELTFLNFTCTNPLAKEKNTPVTTYQCGLSKNLKRRTLHLEMTFGKDIQYFDLSLSVVLPRRTNDFVLLNLTKMNGCHMLSNKNQIPLLQLSRKILDHYSNLPKQCPLRANILYYIRGFRLDIDLFPAFTFENDMNAKFEYIIDKKVALKGFINTHVGLKGST